MNKLKQKIRMFGFMVLIILGVIGASMGGGIPVLPKKKEDSEAVKIELIETENLTNDKKDESVNYDALILNFHRSRPRVP
jgi:hypothetical protein